MGMSQPKAFAPPMAQGQATNAYQTLNQSQAPQQLAQPYLLPFDVNQNQSMPFMQSPNSVRPQDIQSPVNPAGGGSMLRYESAYTPKKSLIY